MESAPQETNCLHECVSAHLTEERVYGFLSGLPQSGSVIASSLLFRQTSSSVWSFLIVLLHLSAEISGVRPTQQNHLETPLDKGSPHSRSNHGPRGGG
ncbi:hypothetical protein LEMLEM_LOCUS27497 [Lemmus lemmus]